MFANTMFSRSRRRGVVLVVVLAMLGLLALIGVTFATFANQAQINAGNFAQNMNTPDASEMMDWALSQLIEDTANPQSVIRGHSMKRDMYGSDAWNNGAFLNGNPDIGGPMVVSGVTKVTSVTPNYLALTTNIPVAGPSIYGSPSFIGWTIRFGSQSALSLNLGSTSGAASTFVTSESFEIIGDNRSGTTVQLNIAIPYSNATNLSPSLLPAQPANGIGTYAVGIDGYASFGNAQSVLASSVPQSNLNSSFSHSIPINTAFVLDGRFMRAFNGAGIGTLPEVLPSGSAYLPRSMAEMGNFRYNGALFLNSLYTGPTPYTPVYSVISGNPDYLGDATHAGMPAMDEDYDACDLENWFLAIQSADGSIAIPSFHRPGILSRNVSPALANTDNDWTRQWANATTADQQLLVLRAMSRILRPRQIDGHSPLSFPDLIPDSTGNITYDVDNDGDGKNESVWLDLGYPPRRNAEGKSYKPMFAFLVIGLNGKLPLNTAGNLADREDATDTLHYDHTDHLGVSPSEVDLKYALMNAYPYVANNPASLIRDFNGNPITPFVWYNTGSTPANLVHPYTQVDNAGIVIPGDNPIPVWTTQLRNLTTGTRLPDAAYNPVVSKPAITMMSPYLTFTSPNTPTTNGDINVVMTGGTNAGYVFPDAMTAILNNTTATLLPNGVADIGDYPSSTAATDPRTGNPITFYVNVGSAAVAGRWGEEFAVPQYLEASPLMIAGGPAPSPSNPYPPNYIYHDPGFIPQVATKSVDAFGLIHPGPGHSVAFAALDARDDNNNTYDPYPVAASGTSPETGDLYDAAGAIVLPVERIRRFVTPIDITGDGYISSFNAVPLGGTGRHANRARNYGGDATGRVAFFHYFRPPGLPINTFYGLTAGIGGDAYPPQPTTLAAGNVVYTSPARAIHSPTFYSTATPYTDGRTNNLYHGFNASISPNVSMFNAALKHGTYFAGTPTDIAADSTEITAGPPVVTIGALNVAAPTVPTFSATINSNQAHVGSALNEADEMDLYNPNRLDAAFGPADIEWLYRQQDVDGISLQSRLQSLAPISFMNSLDGVRRRRMFTTDMWELNNYVWANDNPSNAFSFNSSFTQVGSASSVALGIAKPSVAHRDKRINLNFPLPVSNSPVEPIRQKWIRETYTMLKSILPPKSVDTPEELAQLSQFVVNIIDFRDPDCTITKFVNTDLIVTPGTPAVGGAMPTPSNPSSLAFNTAGTLPASGTPYDASLDHSSAVVTAGSPQHFLIQYGMENQPVALNEVLAYRFMTNMTRPTGAVTTTSDPNFVSGMFVELVNMLTQDAITATPDASNLDLTGWDFVIMPDDGTGRPDPLTGQIPDTTTGNPIAPIAYPIVGSTAVTAIAPGTTLPTAPLTTTLTALGADGTPTYYAIGGISSNPTLSGAGTLATLLTPTTLPGGASSVSSTGLAGQLNTFSQMNPSAAAISPYDDQYYWLYLRRPLNPFDPTFDPTKPNDNRVVVDSFRFVYSVASNRVHSAPATSPNTGKQVTSPPDTPAGASDIMFSLQRMQPFRGGHAVPPLTGVNSVVPNYLVTAYGYSEQSDIPSFLDTLNLVGQYQETTAGGVNSVATQANTTPGIYHSLGRKDPAAAIAGNYDTYWDYFPFNDRDFTGVIELTMVPSCSPGLFTKQFCELPPPITLMSSNGNTYTPVGVPFNPATGYTAPTAPPFTVATWKTTTPGNVLWNPVLPLASAGYGFTGAGFDPPQFNGNLAPHSFPYLNDEFFYTAANENAVTKTGLWWPEMGTPPTPAPGSTPSYRSPATVSANQPLGAFIGGPGGAGWHKMFDFFEVPSTSGKSTGAVASGWNYDWYRQDTRPGLLNINLIVDEEVFLGVMGSNLYGQFNSPGQGVLNSVQVPTNLNPSTQPPYLPILNGQVGNYNFGVLYGVAPSVVNEVDDYGSPLQITSTTGVINAISATAVNSIGVLDTYYDPTLGLIYPIDPPSGLNVPLNQMKACFSDFLKLRHGGSGYLFAFGSGATGQVGIAPSGTIWTTTPLAAERPFHSLSYPDIDYTILRPATLPPSPYTTPAATVGTNAPNFSAGTFPPFPATVDPLYIPSTPYSATNPPKEWSIGWTPRDTTATVIWPYTATGNTAPSWFYTQDPGVKSPYLYTRCDPIQPPAIPPRRLFQVPDYWGYQLAQYGINGSPAGAPYPLYLTPASTGLGYQVQPISNASSAYNVSNADGTDSPPTVPVATGDPAVSNQVLSPSLSFVKADLCAPQSYGGTTKNYYLGGASTATAPFDQRDHPYFRTEWLQKVVNQTTVRTHQYAVWITVAFFEVTSQGNPLLANTVNYASAYDILGLEVGALDGNNVRYRGFFLIDRTNATGFNPQSPGDFRSCVVYRRMIE
jgi:large repetitive protein